jgi:hypothetical protein
MAWYYGTYSCGHEGRVNVIGKVKDRQWKVDRHFEGFCAECWEIEKQKRFDEANAKAAAEAAEMDLPELTGTDKQVAWANTLRQTWIEQVQVQLKKDEEFLERQRERYPESERVPKAEKALNLFHETTDRLLLQETSAKFWIDNRFESPTDILKAEAKKVAEEKAAPEVPQAVEEEALEEMTIRPSEPATTLVAEIRFEDDLVTAKLPEKNEDFRLLLRELKFSWENGRWERQIGIRSGAALDRATELGVKLIEAGFPIRVYDETLQKKILATDYDPECSRWIMQNTKTGKFLVTWDRNDGDFYSPAKALPGARWKSGAGMLVPREAFREVLDFADRYQFQLSPGAKKAVDEAQAAFDAAMVADVSAPETDSLPQPGERPVLTADQVDGEIDADLS